MEKLAQADELRAYVHTGFWQPMDTLRDRHISRRASGLGGTRQVEDLVIDRRLLARPPRLPDRPYRLQGRVAALLLRRWAPRSRASRCPPKTTESVRDGAGRCRASPPRGRRHPRSRSAVRASVSAAEPEIVLHMAAQSLVRLSYARAGRDLRDQRDGHRALLEAVRSVPSVRAVVIVTSDKCYENTGAGLGLPRRRPAGRPRSLQQQQGLRRAGHRLPIASSFFPAGGQSACRIGPRRQRDRRRRLGARPAGARRDPRIQRQTACFESAIRMRPALAACARPAQRLSAPGAVAI